MKPGPFLGFMAYGLRKGGLRTKPVTDLATIDGDATLDLPGIAARDPARRATRRAASRSTCRWSGRCSSATG